MDLKAWRLSPEPSSSLVRSGSVAVSHEVKPPESGSDTFVVLIPLAWPAISIPDFVTFVQQLSGLRCFWSVLQSLVPVGCRD